MIRRSPVRSALTGLAVVVLAACSGGAGTPPNPTPSVPPRFPATSDAALPDATASALQSVLEAGLTTTGMSGLTAAVVVEDGWWAGASGVDGAGTALEPSSAMNICSITKTYVAAEVMKLAGQGDIDLDAPMSDYVTAPFDTSTATVRETLAMRSGFPTESADLKAAIAADLTREWTVEDSLHYLSTGATGAVGGTPVYNNVNYWLLADLISEVTGTTWAQALREDPLDPAGLDRTWVQTAEAPEAPLAVGTDASTDEISLIDRASTYLPSTAAASSRSGSGAIAADAADVARLGYLLYGGRLIDQALVEQMTTSPDDSTFDGFSEYGLGTMLVPDFAIEGHVGCGDDDYSTMLWVFPELGASVAVLAPEPNGLDFMPMFDVAANLAARAGSGASPR